MERKGDVLLATDNPSDFGTHQNTSRKGAKPIIVLNMVKWSRKIMDFGIRPKYKPVLAN